MNCVAQVLLYIVIFLSFVGCVAAVVDSFLSTETKQRLDHAIGNTRIWLASVKSGPIVSQARGRWVFAASIFAAAAVVFALLGSRQKRSRRPRSAAQSIQGDGAKHDRVFDSRFHCSG